MLNMHTIYLACESCHLENAQLQKAAYRWYSPMEKNPKGPFFGTAYDPETGELMTGDDPYSKITPFFKSDEGLEPVLHIQNAPMAKDYVNVRDQLTPEQREGITKRFHVDIQSKGPDCQACHATKGLFKFKELGFTEKRTFDLELLNIKGILTKYDEFYLPDLFRQEGGTAP